MVHNFGESGGLPGTTLDHFSFFWYETYIEWNRKKSYYVITTKENAPWVCTSLQELCNVLKRNKKTVTCYKAATFQSEVANTLLTLLTTRFLLTPLKHSTMWWLQNTDKCHIWEFQNIKSLWCIFQDIIIPKGKNSTSFCPNQGNAILY